MCICINCKYILICDTYQSIEKQHQYNKLLQKNTFIPQNTIISANLNNSKNCREIDWDIIECLSFIEKPGYWANSKVKF